MVARRRNSPASLAAAAILAFAAGMDPAASRAEEAKDKDASPVTRTCELIETHAAGNGLPPAFLARLIWKESRFDPNAVSPKGAEGIAQFMPATAKLRGLADAFDVEQAIPAAASYLAELSRKYGNKGLAAAAYNAGEGRVSRWLASGGFLPLETENYVLDIMGAPADSFIGSTDGETPPLHKEKSFAAACRELPIVRSATIAMARVPVKPWGVQVAGSFNRAAAIRSWQSLKVRNAALARVEPVVSRVRSPIGRKGIYAVRIGAETRAEADELCRVLRGAGGSCVVMRNR